MRVLVADDEPNIRASLQRYLELDGAEVVIADNGLAAQRRLQQETFAAAVIDLRMPGMDGLELLRWMRAERPRLPAIMISAYGEVADAVAAMKLGAGDYLVKPFDPEELVLRLTKLVEAQALRDHAEAAGRAAGDAPPALGESAAMARIETLVRRVAPTPSTVLVTGESGTGKEVAARALHHHSARTGPFVPVNTGGIPEALLESELFGYERGAFTGATQRKIGMFELADAGTLFLDEIGEMAPQLQVKLLRAVQERRIQRLGATVEVPIAARLVAATNRALEEEVAAGRFREDLYYRLNVVRIHLPPLRERLDDLPLLAGRILTRLNRTMGRQLQGLSPAALQVLGGYRFPGNVRELENILERAVIFAEGATIGPDDLDLGAARPEHSRAHPDPPQPDHGPAAPGVESGGAAGARRLPLPRQRARAGDPLTSCTFILERAVIFAEGATIGPDDLDLGAARPGHTAAAAEPAAFRGTLKEQEQRLIETALSRWEGNRTRAAEELGITRRTLFNKLRQLGLG